MRVALTGTPGTGKTSVSDRLDVALEIVHLGDVIEREGLVAERDETRGTDVVDVEELIAETRSMDEVVFESHLSHHLPVDRVVVLRCDPAELEARLRSRGEPTGTIEENAESEALDLILSEAVARHGRDAVYEIDTTELDLDAVVAAVEAAIEGSMEPRAGTVDFTGYL